MKYLFLILILVPSVLLAQVSTTEKIVINRDSATPLLNGKANSMDAYSYDKIKTSRHIPYKGFSSSEEVSSNIMLKQECVSNLLQMALADLYKGAFCTTANCQLDPKSFSIIDTEQGLTSRSKSVLMNKVLFGTSKSSYTGSVTPESCTLLPQDLRAALMPIYIDETKKTMTFLTNGATFTYPVKLKLVSDPLVNNDINLVFQEDYKDAGGKRTFSNLNVKNLSGGAYVRAKDETNKLDKPITFKLPASFYYTTGISKGGSILLDYSTRSFGDKTAKKELVLKLSSGGSGSGAVEYTYVVKAENDPISKAVCPKDQSIAGVNTDPNKCEGSSTSACCFMKLPIANKI